MKDRELLAGKRKVFIVGSPRSGTTWLQLLLDQHSRVVTAPESQIFAYYLDHFRRQWRHETDRPSSHPQGSAGLSRVLAEDEFHELCRRAAAFVLASIARRDPGCEVVVEKSPRHALHVEWIARLFPDAAFLHVIRDPRDVAASLLHAANTWAGSWAPRHPVEAARMWCRNVNGALVGRTLGDRYREVRFEDLKASTVDELAGVYEWLGFPADRDRCEEAVEACRLERLQERAGEEDLPVPGSRSPGGFFRRGQVGGYRKDLSLSGLAMVERECAATMEAVGYEPTADRGAVWAARIALHDGLQRLREAVDWQLEKALFRV